MTRSVNYVSGMPDRLLPEDVTTVPKFTEYARQELGLSYPVGKGRREGWMRFCKAEMKTQNWSFEQLVVAVGYIKAGKRSCRTLYGILYYVDEAGARKIRRDFDMTTHDLQVNVADALNVERDETWRRKLALARGQALAMVYEQWRSEHDHLVDRTAGGREDHPGRRYGDQIAGRSER